MTVRVNGIDLFFTRCGKGRPFLLLHGNGETHEIFRPLLDLLAKDYTVYAPDSRCHGQSGCGTLGYQEIADDIVGLIQHFCLHRPVLCGFSDGGIVGLLIAAQHPQLLSGLIACGANLNPNGLKARWRMLFRMAYTLNRDEKLRLMLCQPQISHEMLEQIKIPSLIVAGSRDMIRTSHTKGIASAIPSANLRILPGECHGSYIVDSAKIYDVILPFLKEHGL